MKKYNVFLLGLVVILFSSNSLVRGEEAYPQIKAVVNPTETTIGVPVEYRVSIAGPQSDLKIVLPEKKELFPDKEKSGTVSKGNDTQIAENPAEKKIPIYVINNVSKEDSSDTDIMYQSVIMHITFYRAGTYTLPAIQFIGSDGVAIGYKIPEINIKPSNPEGEFVPIEQPLSLKGNYTRLWLLIAAAILLGGMLVALFIGIRKWLKAREDRVLQLPPKVVFKTSLAELQQAGLLEQGQVEAFVSRLSVIFRKFLSQALHCDALEMTNLEIYNEMKKHVARGKYSAFVKEMRELMELWDLSKFAEFMPSEDMLKKNVYHLEKFVDNAEWEAGNVRF